MEKQPVELGLYQPDYWYVDAMEKLVDVVQHLSHARDLETVAELSLIHI